MLTVREAQQLTGVGAGQLLLLALTCQIPSHKDPDSRLILFEAVLAGKTEEHRANYVRRVLQNHLMNIQTSSEGIVTSNSIKIAVS
jgi:hypothetical protein